jgi:MFS family permease
MFNSAGWVIAIVFMLNGFLSGLSYNFLSKIMLKYGASSKSLKYVSLYELFNGMGFGAAPLLVGFIAEINIKLNFMVLFIFLVVSLCILMKLGEKGRKSL